MVGGEKRGSTCVFGEGELAVIHLRLSLHLVLGLPALIVRVAGVLDVNIPQIIRHIIWDGEVKVNTTAAPTSPRVRAGASAQSGSGSPTWSRLRVAEIDHLNDLLVSVQIHGAAVRAVHAVGELKASKTNRQK